MRRLNRAMHAFSGPIPPSASYRPYNKASLLKKDLPPTENGFSNLTLWGPLMYLEVLSKALLRSCNTIHVESIYISPLSSRAILNFLQWQILSPSSFNLLVETCVPRSRNNLQSYLPCDTRCYPGVEFSNGLRTVFWWNNCRYQRFILVRFQWKSWTDHC